MKPGEGIVATFARTKNSELEKDKTILSIQQIRQEIQSLKIEFEAKKEKLLSDIHLDFTSVLSEIENTINELSLRIEIDEIKFVIEKAYDSFSHLLLKHGERVFSAKDAMLKINSPQIRRAEYFQEIENAFSKFESTLNSLSGI